MLLQRHLEAKRHQVLQDCLELSSKFGCNYSTHSRTKAVYVNRASLLTTNSNQFSLAHALTFHQIPLKSSTFLKYPEMCPKPNTLAEVVISNHHKLTDCTIFPTGKESLIKVGSKSHPTQMTALSVWVWFVISEGP